MANNVQGIDVARSKRAEFDLHVRDLLKSVPRGKFGSGAVGYYWKGRNGRLYTIDEIKREISLSNAKKNKNRTKGKKLLTDKERKKDNRKNHASTHTKPFDPSVAKYFDKIFKRADVFTKSKKKAVAKYNKKIEGIKSGEYDVTKKIFSSYTTSGHRQFKDQIVANVNGTFSSFEGISIKDGQVQFSGGRHGGKNKIPLDGSKLPSAIGVTITALPAQALKFVGIMSKIAESVFKGSFEKSGFNTSGGGRWQPLAASTIAKRSRRNTLRGSGRYGYQILNETGALQNSITSSEPRMGGGSSSFGTHEDVVTTGASDAIGEVYINTNVLDRNPYNVRKSNYAVFHNFGSIGKKLPKRQFMGHSSYIEKEASVLSDVCFLHASMY